MDINQITPHQYGGRYTGQDFLIHIALHGGVQGAEVMIVADNCPICYGIWFPGNTD